MVSERPVAQATIQKNPAIHARDPKPFYLPSHDPESVERLQNKAMAGEHFVLT